MDGARRHPSFDWSPGWRKITWARYFRVGEGIPWSIQKHYADKLIAHIQNDVCGSPGVFLRIKKKLLEMLELDADIVPDCPIPLFESSYLENLSLWGTETYDRIIDFLKK